jgi:hypothetical protein
VGPCDEDVSSPLQPPTETETEETETARPSKSEVAVRGTVPFGWRMSAPQCGQLASVGRR